MIGVRSSVVLFLLVCCLPLTFRCVETEEQELVTMYMTNPVTGNNTFNVSGAFTVIFYIGNVTDLIAWQIHLSYNRSLIHYVKTGVPEDNVFKEAIDRGATPLMEAFNNVDDATDVTDLIIVMASNYPSDASNQYAVSVASKGLLCMVNFTVVSHQAYAQLDFIRTSAQAPYGLHIVPTYHLADWGTLVETANGTYPAGGESAMIFETDPIAEFSGLLLPLILLLAIFCLALTKRI